MCVLILKLISQQHATTLRTTSSILLLFFYILLLNLCVTSKIPDLLGPSKLLLLALIERVFLQENCNFFKYYSMCEEPALRAVRDSAQ